MATNWGKETRSNEKKIDLLAASNSYTSKYLSDQNIFKLGTNRRSEILGKIGGAGKPFEEAYNDYLDTL